MKSIITRLSLLLGICVLLPILVLLYINSTVPLSTGTNAIVIGVTALITTVLGIVWINRTIRPLIKTITQWESLVDERWEQNISFHNTTLKQFPELDRLIHTARVNLEDKKENAKRLADLVETRTAKLVHSESQAKVSKARLQSVVDSSPKAVLVTDATGKIYLTNPALNSLLELNPESEISSGDLVSFLRMKFGNHSRAIACWRSNAGETDNIITEKWEAPGDDGIKLDVYSAPVAGEDDPDSYSRLWILKDETEDRKASQEREHNERLEAVGRLAGGIAHDFNNLLTALSGHLQLLQQRIGSTLNGEDRQSLTTAQLAATRGSELVKQLLRFSRKQEAEIVPVQISEILHEVRNLLTHSIDPRIDLITDIPKKDLWGMGEVGQLQQVILNVAINARDAITGHGRITLRCLPSERIEEDGDHEWINIEVEDDGSGMSPEIQEQIFEPFFSTKGQGEGAGFGLATAHGIIQRFGGEITCTSKEGVGSTFHIALRRCPAPNETRLAPEAIVTRPSIPEDQNSTILVVDDEAAVRAVAEGSLKLGGFKVLTAADGEEAIRILTTAGQPPIDLVLLDMTMPKLSGAETFESVRKKGIETPVVFCSGQLLDPDEIKESVGWRPQGIIQKPYNITELPIIVQDTILTGAN